MEKRLEMDRLLKKLYILLEKDCEWYKKENTVLYNRIQKIGREIWMLNDSETRLEKLTVEKYEKIQKKQKNLVFVAKSLGVTVEGLKRWRKNNNLL